MKPKEYIWMKVETERRTGEHNESEQHKKNFSSQVRMASQDQMSYYRLHVRNSTLIRLFEDIKSQIDWDTNVKSMAKSKEHFLQTLGFLG